MFVALLLMALTRESAAFGAAAESPAAPAQALTTQALPRVLVLCSGDRLLPVNELFDASLRRALESHSERPIDCSGEFLDEVRFPVRFQERMRDLLRVKYDTHPPDVIVAFGPASLDFCLEFRPQLFPEVPIVFAAIGADGADRLELGNRVTGVCSMFDGPGTLRLALRLHPRTQQVFVLDGSAGPDRSRAKAWPWLDEHAFGTTIRDLPTRPLPQLLDTLTQLPDHSLVLLLPTLGGGEGNDLVPPEAVERMTRASRAPIYTIFDIYVGSGVVGAVTTPMDVIGRETAEAILEILSRSDPDALPPVEILEAKPLFDWRQVQRWGLRKSQLPPDSVLLFRAPSLWRQHYRLFIMLGSLLLLQSGLILALVLQSRRRRLAEREELQRRQELAHMTRVATMGELTASLAHEINQPLTAILTNAQAAQSLLEAGDTNLEEIQEILADIAADDERAGEVIRRMRTLLRKGVSELAILDVNDLVTEVVGLVRGEMILHNVALTLDLSPDLPRVHGDRVQLQQVILNLVVNAIDAMKDVSGGMRRMTVRTGMGKHRVVQVSIVDSGGGIPEEARERIFEPFVTTKLHGLGLGLSICRSIIQSHGGRIECTNNADRGATFSFTLPAEEEAKR